MKLVQKFDFSLQKTKFSLLNKNKIIKVWTKNEDT